MARREKLVGVQYLRAIAALMVTYFHVVGEIPAYMPYLSGGRWISTPAFRGGVQIFFVISGFVMYVSSIDSTSRLFVRRRLARIVPLYWIMTLAVVALALYAPRLASRTDCSVVYLIKSLTFIPYANPGHHGEIYPLLVPGWSLNYEMFFYALFAGCLLIRPKWRTWCLLSTLGLLCLAGFSARWADPMAITYTSPLLLLFGVGFGLGCVYRRRMIVMSPVVSLVIALAGLLLLVGPWSGGDPVIFVASILIVSGTVALDSSGTVPCWPWLLLLGDASYSLYLGHTFVLSVGRVAWERLKFDGPMAAAGFATISILASIAAAILTYRLIEQPSLRIILGRRQITPSTHQATA